MDNYYTSVALFEELDERKTLACGTVRSNRVDLPREICGLKEKAVKEFPQPGLTGLYKTFLGGVDVSYQRTVAYARLTKGAVWYYKMRFLHLEVCIKCTPSPNEISESLQ